MFESEATEVQRLREENARISGEFVKLFHVCARAQTYITNHSHSDSKPILFELEEAITLALASGIDVGTFFG